MFGLAQTDSNNLLMHPSNGANNPTARIFIIRYAPMMERDSGTDAKADMHDVGFSRHQGKSHASQQCR